MHIPCAMQLDAATEELRKMKQACFHKSCRRKLTATPLPSRITRHIHSHSHTGHPPAFSCSPPSLSYLYVGRLLLCRATTCFTSLLGRSKSCFYYYHLFLAHASRSKHPAPRMKHTAPRPSIKHQAPNTKNQASSIKHPA